MTSHERPSSKSIESIESERVLACYEWLTSKHDEEMPEWSTLGAERIKGCDRLKLKHFLPILPSRAALLSAIYAAGMSDESITVWCGDDWQQQVEELKPEWPRIKGQFNAPQRKLPSDTLISVDYTDNTNGTPLCDEIDIHSTDETLPETRQIRQLNKFAQEVCKLCELNENCPVRKAA